MLGKYIIAVSCKKSNDTYKYNVEKIQGFGMLNEALHGVTAELETVNGQFPQFNIPPSQSVTQNSSIRPGL